jgi:hypothetical protein
MFGDVLVARRLGSHPGWWWIVGGGAGGVLGGTTDECVLEPDGGCAPKGNYLNLNGVAGAGVTFGVVDVHGAIGPSAHLGGGGRSIGMEWRLDIAPHVSWGLKPAVMARVTTAPKHNHARQSFIAIGVSLQRWK